METKPGIPESDKAQQHSDEDELEDLTAPVQSQEDVAGGTPPKCGTWGPPTTPDTKTQ